MTNQDLAAQVASAIDMIRRVRFADGSKPGDDADVLIRSVYEIARRAPKPLYLRVFQKHGISSVVVADAVRAGVLRVIETQGAP